jgi:hypothetical protein
MIQQLEIKRFAKSLIIIGVGVLLFDFVIGSGLKYLYTKQKSGLLYRTSYSIDSTRADYIVLGSSRANHNYDPKVFENTLKSSFYNCGRDKQGLVYSCAVLSAILERYQPKCVIIDIRPDEFTQSDEGSLATLLPYRKNAAIRPYLDYNGKFESVKFLSHIYPYNSLFTNLIVGLKKNWKEDYKGYRALTNLNPDPALDTLKENIPLDTIKVKVFHATLARLTQLQIPTYLVISPIHYIYISKYTVDICLKNAREFSNIKFLNYTNKAEWRDNSNFSDHNHLNQQGAALFSATLAEEIQKSLNE